MNCPQCDGKTTVYGTTGENTSRVRYRACLACGHAFRTIETLMIEKTVKPRKQRHSPNLDGPNLFDEGFQP